MKNKTKKVSLKNYLIAFSIGIGTILLIFYFVNVYKSYRKALINDSYLIKNKIIVNEIKSLEELSSVVRETPNQFFVYITYTNSEEVYNLEKNLKPIIEKDKLKELIYYFDVSHIKNETTFYPNLAKIIKTNEVKIVPTILYFKDHELVDDGIVQREDGQTIKATDFVQLLDKYEIKND